MATKSKVKNQVKVQNPQKAHLHPLRDVCVQYENNPANSLRDISGNWTYHPQSIQVNNHLKIKSKKIGQRS